MNNYPTNISTISEDKKYMMSRSINNSEFDLRTAPSQIDVSPKCYQSFHRMFMTANLLMLIAGLVLIGTGAGLMGFYRVHMLDVITMEFLFVPLFMIGGGAITLFIAVFGFYADVKDNQCMLVTYAVLLTGELFILIAAIGCSVHLLFVIQTGIFDADVIPELTLYQVDPMVRYKWDTLQREFSCCGGYGYTLGYTDWKHTVIGGAHNAVPDSCCLQESPGCGHNVFNISDIRVVIGKIHTHGCLTTMMRRLDTHVMIILIVFCVVGGFLAILELLMVVLSCCMASSTTDYTFEDEKEFEKQRSGRGRSRSPSTGVRRARSRSSSMRRHNPYLNTSMDMDDEHYRDGPDNFGMQRQNGTGCMECRGKGQGFECHHCGHFSRPTSPMSENL